MNMTNRKVRYNAYYEGFTLSYTITKIWRMRLLVRAMKRTHRNRLNIKRTFTIDAYPKFWIPSASATCRH